MATAKLATLFIRTLAKPIATQLKTQAAAHDSFRRVCVTIAQTMHRSEMALRYNLLPRAQKGSDDHERGERPKVRPLNEAKAIANGANFLSEAFLFAIAAGLILGESYRSSVKSRQQRNRTEERVEEVSNAVEALCQRLGVDARAVGLGEMEETDQKAFEEEASSDSSAATAESKQEASRHAAAQQHRHQHEEEILRLRKAVDVLLRMSIQNGVIQGPEALNLTAIMEGKENRGEEARESAEPTRAHQTGKPASPASEEQDRMSPILREAALVRARQLAEMSRVGDSSERT